MALIAGMAQIYLLLAVPTLAASISDFGDLKPVSINNRSQVLVVIKQSGELAIWQRGKLTRTGLISRYSARNINDNGHILLNEDINHGENAICVWNGAHKQRVAPAVLKESSGNWIDNQETILVSDARGIGICYHGTIQWLINPRPDYTITATAMNDRHQIVGVIMGPMTKGKSQPKFSAHLFVWEHGVFHYLKSPGKGILYPFSINNHGEVVGEFEPADAVMTRKAVLWKDSRSVPIDLNVWMHKRDGWRLTVAVDINDKGEIIGNGVHNGVRSSFILSATQADH